MTTWFTSDTHFGHTNIVEYCNRPFSDVHEMDQELIRRWNDRVAPEDTVWHLGDFCMGKAENIDRYRALLNGKLNLVLGNHDRSAHRMKAGGFNEIYAAFLLVQGGLPLIWLTHRPPRTEAWKDNASLCLHGHVHTEYARKGDLINVGVDVRGFAPVTLEELLK